MTSRNIAEATLAAQINVGVPAMQKLVQQIASTTIKDYLAKPERLLFKVQPNKAGITNVFLSFLDDEDDICEIHYHALNQIKQTVGLDGRHPGRWLTGGNAYEHALLAHTLNVLYENGDFTDRKGNPTSFLIRRVGDEVRGFLTRYFRRDILSYPILSNFLKQAGELKAFPVIGANSGIRIWIKCILPEVFEPYPGEFIAFGVELSHSDFGAASLTVAGTILHIASGARIVLGDAYSQRHIGPLVQDSDLEVSPETSAKELVAIYSAMGDVIKRVLNEENLDRILEAISEARTRKIPWAQLKNQFQNKILTAQELKQIEEMAQKGVAELPAVEYEADTLNAYWLALALGRLASNTIDPQKAADIEAAAGTLLNI